MRIADMKTIELGTASAVTRGCLFGFADVELGLMLVTGLTDD
ncbi:hypothetical protein [Sphingomonas sp. MS122]